MNTIYIIGPGKLGTALASAIFRVVDNPMVIVAEREKDIDLLNHHFPSTQIELYDPAFIPQKDSILFLTVPDNIIQDLSAATAFNLKSWKNYMIFHFSGTLTSSILKTFRDKSATVASLHPLQTFSSLFMPPSVFKDVYFTFEGDEENFNFALELTRKLGSKIVKIDAKTKTAYHISAVIASNFVCGVLDFSERIFTRTNLGRDEFKKMLYPLVEKSVQNFFDKGGKSALTGPLARGNDNIILEHISDIKNVDKDYLELYKSISNYILKYLSDLDDLTYNKISKMLD